MQWKGLSDDCVKNTTKNFEEKAIPNLSLLGNQNPPWTKFPKTVELGVWIELIMFLFSLWWILKN